MKIIHSAILALTIGAATMTSAQARDSFSFGLNIGGYPPPVYYAPPVVYYNEPVVYYQPVPRYYSYAPYHNYAPSVISFGYFNDGRRRHHGDWGHEEHEEHEHRRWDHDGDRHERGDWR